MLVDVIELRNRGQRLPVERVRAAVPLRGVLSISAGRPGWYPGQRHPALLASLLDPERTESVLPPLDRARVAKIERGKMLVVGMQQALRWRDLTPYQQAWVVWPAVAVAEASR